MWATFEAEDGTSLRRPAFFDGSAWRIRFTSPVSSTRWEWRTDSRPAHPDLQQSGIVQVGDAINTATMHGAHGFWCMSPGGRSLVHADGSPAILVADTAWALPWRATLDDARTYARDREIKGFNAALLMTVQPDMRAAGPRDRTADEGFDIGFEDLPGWAAADTPTARSTAADTAGGKPTSTSEPQLAEQSPPEQQPDTPEHC